LPPLVQNPPADSLVSALVDAAEEAHHPSITVLHVHAGEVKR
jgi:hypothetical protein